MSLLQLSCNSNFLPTLFGIYIKNEYKNVTLFFQLILFNIAEWILAKEQVRSYCPIYILWYPSRIEPQQDHAVINSGDTWEVNCTGEAPLEWEYSNRYGKVVKLPTLSTPTLAKENKWQKMWGHVLCLNSQRFSLTKKNHV